VTLFGWAGKRLNYCIINLFRKMFTRFYQNQLGFMEDMTKTFWCVFSVHSVEVKKIQKQTDMYNSQQPNAVSTGCWRQWQPLPENTVQSSVLTVFCTNFSRTKLIIPRLPQIDWLFDWWWCLNIASYKNRYWIFTKYFTSGSDFLYHIVKVGLKAVTMSLQF